MTLMLQHMSKDSKYFTAGVHHSAGQVLYIKGQLHGFFIHTRLLTGL